MLKIGKSKKFHKKCHSIKNTFLFPNFHTRAPKLMIKPKNNLKNLKILVKIHFLTKLQVLRKNDKYWKKWVKLKFISIFDHYEMFWHQKLPPVFFLIKAISCQKCCMSTFLTCSFLKILNWIWMGWKPVSSVKHSWVLHAVFERKTTNSIGEMSN